MKNLIKKILKLEVKEKDYDLAGGILAFIFSIIFYISTLHTKNLRNDPIKAETVPRFVCYILFGLGIALVIRWLKNRKKYADSSAEPEKELDKLDIFAKITPITSMVLLFIYIQLMKPIGFLLASIVYLSLQIPLLKADLTVKSFLKALIIGSISSTLIFLIFAKGFGLYLPKTGLGF